MADEKCKCGNDTRIKNTGECRPCYDKRKHIERQAKKTVKEEQKTPEQVKVAAQVEAFTEAEEITAQCAAMSALAPALPNSQRNPLLDLAETESPLPDKHLILDFTDYPELWQVMREGAPESIIQPENIVVALHNILVLKTLKLRLPV